MRGRGGSYLMIKAAVQSPLRESSGVERSRFRRLLRWFLQAFRKTLGTRAETAQVVKGVNAGVVAVTPAKSQRIIAYRRYAYTLQTSRYASGEDLSHSGEFIDAVGTQAIFP